MMDHRFTHVGIEPLAIAANVLLLGLIIAAFVFWVVELVDCTRREFKDSNEKLMWILIILLAQGVGAIVYYAVGKQRGRLPGVMAARL